MMSDDKTYLLDDIEVVFTGRIANRNLKNNKVDTRHEIKPSDNANGSWTKWVRKIDLYEISQKEEE